MDNVPIALGGDHAGRQAFVFYECIRGDGGAVQIRSLLAGTIAAEQHNPVIPVRTPVDVSCADVGSWWRKI